MKSMSKAYGICGLRIGYLLTADEDLARRIRDELHIWNVNGFAEEFLRLAPRFRQEFAESCQSVRAERDALYEDLRTVPGLLVYRPDANFIFCRLPEGCAFRSRRRAEAVCRGQYLHQGLLWQDDAGPEPVHPRRQSHDE